MNEGGESYGRSQTSFVSAKRVHRHLETLNSLGPNSQGAAPMLLFDQFQAEREEGIDATPNRNLYLEA